MKDPLIEISIPTADGNFTAHYSEKGLAGLDWPTKKVVSIQRGRRGDESQIFPNSGASNGDASRRLLQIKILRWHRVTAAALKNILAGRGAKKLPPLDWSGKTKFQQAVWREMLKIPAGQTRSYGEIAARIKNPKAVRAVGGACGANPVPVLVPCHRILAANKKIGGFSGGLDWKRSLLAREGVSV
ncbi:MAG TPA: MGMT family protein [Verrucomicrobiae bacterium]